MEPTDNAPATSESQPEDKTDYVSSATETLWKRSEKKTANIENEAHRRLGKQGRSISTELSPSPLGPSAKKHIPAGGIDLIPVPKYATACDMDSSLPTSPFDISSHGTCILLTDREGPAEYSQYSDDRRLIRPLQFSSSDEQSQCPNPKPVIMSINEFSPSSCQTVDSEHFHIAGSKPTFIDLDHSAEEKAPGEILLPSSINRSSHFSEAKKMAGIPFLHHTILECDHHSREYTIQDHDITLRIPEGAVSTGRKIRFEIAVAMYGPFKFEKDTQPISPILWLCFEGGVTLNKPFHVILPHFLTGLTYEKAQYHQIVFAKAPHTVSKYSVENGEIKYSFQPCDTKPYFASCGGRNFGVLVTNHTCFYCLQASTRKTPQLAMDAGYCLARIEYLNQRHMEVTFTAVYCLPTCLKAMEAQFPYEEGYRITDYMDFKFKQNTEPHVKVVPTSECDKLVITLIPTSAKIRAGDINFWRKNLDSDAMQLRHEKKMYPPRVKMTVGMKNPDDHDIYKLLVKIEGCSEEDQLDIQLCFPPSTPPSVSGSASSSMSQSECQSPKIKVQERPELKDVFRELLPLSAGWNIIGTLLGLPEDLLERIRANEERAENRLQKVLSGWLKQVDPRPTWAALVEAMEHVDKVKAQEIKTRYIDIDLQ